MHTKSLLVVLLVVVAAAAAWFAFGGGAAPDLPVAPSSPEGTAAHAADAVRATAATAAGGAAPVAEEATAVERTLVPAAETTAVVSGTYPVHGRLVDQQGAARADLRIQCHSWPANGSVEESAAASVPDATSSADGRFTVDVLHGRDGNLTLRDDAFVFANDGRVQFESSAGNHDLGDLVVVRAAVLQGVVQDELGRAVADVVVDASDGMLGFGARSRSKTGADGTFAIGKLRPGTWRLRASSARFLPTTLEVTLAAEERREGLVLVVRPGNAIAGQVVDDRNVGVAGCKVGSKRKETTGVMAIERFSAEEATTSDANGFFTLAGLGEGTATIRAFGPGHSGTTVADVAIGTGNLVLVVQRLAAIEGVLVDAEGAPIVGSKVSANADSRGWGGIDSMPLVQREDVTTAEDGTFRLESVEPGTVTVAARGKGHLPALVTDVHVQPGLTVRGVRLTAAAGAAARALVVDEAGVPVSGARVTAQLPGGGQRFTMTRAGAEFWSDALGPVTTDADGRALLPGLPPGDLTFGAEHPAFAAAPAVTAAVPTTGTIDVRLVLTKPGFVDIHVADARGADAGGRDVRIASVGKENEGSGPARATGADGHVRFGPLAPGVYGATIVRRQDQQHGGDAEFTFGDDDRAVESSRQQFTIAGGETSTLELSVPVMARLHGTVLGLDGPLTDCTVELVRRGEATSDWAGFGSRSVRSGKDGDYVFDEVEAGSYTLTFGRPTQQMKARLDVDVPPNTADLRQDLELHTGRILLHVHEAGTGTPIEGAEAELVRAGAEGGGAAGPTMMIAMLTNNGEGGEAMTVQIGPRPARSNADGQVVIDEVPAGSYKVRVSHDGHDSFEKDEQVVVERQTTDCGRIDLGPTKAK